VFELRELSLSIGEPFTSPAWGSNLVFFSGDPGAVIPDENAKEYLRRCCKYARHYEVYLIPERFMVMGYTCMCLITPQGKVIGAQKAVHLYLPTTPGNKRGTALEVMNTEFGGVFLCVDVDIYHPELVRVAAEMGAQYIFCAQQMARSDYSSHMVISGIWNAAQQNNVFGAAVCNQFHCVCAPLSISPYEDGFLAKPTLKTPVTVKMLADDLERCPKRRLLSRKLYAVHRGELLG